MSELELARTYESDGRLPQFSHHGADVANTSALRAVVAPPGNAFRGADYPIAMANEPRGAASIARPVLLGGHR